MQRESFRNINGRYKADAGPSYVVRNRVAPCRTSGRRRDNALPKLGSRQGQLVVTGYAVGARGGVKDIMVKCKCGAPEHKVNITNFRVGRSSRCNVCAKQAAADKRHAKYKAAMPEAEHRDRLLDRLSAAIRRCHNNRDAHFPQYGGRGIRVCDEWYQDRAAFLRHVRKLKGWDDPSLEMDRKRNDEGYEPGNIRFITHKANINNRRNSSL